MRETTDFIRVAMCAERGEHLCIVQWQGKCQIYNFLSACETISLSRKYLLNVKHDSEVRKKCRREAEKGKIWQKYR